MNALHWLALTTIVTGLFWLPYVLNRMLAVGMPDTLGGDAVPDEKHAAWAQRAKRAHANAVENLVVFATLVLVAVADGQGGASGLTLWAAVYFWSRLAHFAVYTAGLPVVRTLAFFGGFVAQVAVAVMILF
jgi:uncharacterized MAPEG superfamily protein